MDLIELKKVQEKRFNRHPWEQARLKILLSLLNKIPLRNRVVDIGSGDAYIAKSIAKSYPKVSVVAFDINYSKEIKNNLQKECLDNISFVNSINLLKDEVVQPIDIVILMDVIEHIEYPSNLIKEIQRLNGVTNSTQFFITVPAFQILFTNHDKNLGHYKRYNQHDLIELLRLANMKIKYNGYFFNSLLFVRMFQKIIHKDYIDYGLHNWKASKFITWLITNFFWIEFKISWYLSQFRIYLPGLTCYCICHPLP